jgi:transmembrane sensor
MASLDGGKIVFDCRNTDKMKAPKENIPHELLAKYFAGEASVQEQEAVLEWKNLNEDLFNQYFVLWQDMGILRPSNDLPAFDTIKAWKTFQKTNFKTRENNLIWTQAWKIAAVILFFLSVALWFLPRKAETVMLTAVTVENETTNVQLSDGTTVTLNQKSNLKYAGDFGEKSRTIILSGEAFFDVVRDEQRPFTVQAGATNITVLGTSFNVKMDASGSVEVSVLSGKVAFLASSQSVDLVAGQAGIFVSETQELKQKQADKTGINTFWKNKKLSFEGQKLSEVLETIRQVYQVEIQMETPSLAHCQLRVEFENSSIEEVMAVIALTLELEVRKEDAIYILSGKGCAEN